MNRAGALAPEVAHVLIASWQVPALLAVVLVGVSLWSYPLFHTAVELFTVIVAIAAFAVAWNTYPLSRNHYLMYLGCGYFWVGALDLVHALVYGGMALFPGVRGSDIPTQLSLAARYDEAVLFLTAPLFLSRPFSRGRMFWLFGSAAAVLYALVMSGHFPRAFIENAGLTRFKVLSEYAIITLLVAAMAHLWTRRALLSRELLILILSANACVIGGGISFTRYTETHGAANLIGHVIRLFGLWLIYRALVEFTLKQPVEALRRAMAAVREAEERFRSLVTATSQLIWTTDAGGNVTADIPTWRAYTGQTLEEVQGSGWSRALHPDDAQRTLRVWQKAVATRALYEIEYRIRRHDGEFRWFAVRGVPVLEPNGSIREWVGSCTDVTERRRAAEDLERHREHLETLVAARTAAVRDSEERYRTLYESSADGIVHVDMSGRILAANRAYLAMIGYALEEARNLTYIQLTPPRWHAMEAGIVAQQIMARGYSDEYEKEYVRRDGTVFPIAIRVWAIRDPAGTATGMWGIVRDITARKLAERAQREYAAALEASNKELESFSYSVSHDLRVPLRAIDGFSHMLERKYREKLDEEGARMIAVVRDSTRRMGRLIDDILAFSRMGRKEMSMDEVDMGALARAAAEELKPAWAGRDLHWRFADLPRARGDRAMLAQVWTNLIGNAVKFTRPKPRARIEVGADVEQSENVYYVKDDGVGFDMQYAHKLYGVFQRLHGVDEFEGTGAGLAIVKRIITRHAGRVWAEGKVNEGATFFFALPAQNPDAPAPSNTEVAT